MKRILFFMLLLIAVIVGGVEVDAQTSKKSSKVGNTQVQSKQYDWIYGTWSCSGTIDYGPMLGGKQRFTAKLIITKNNLKVYYNGELDYNGSYVIEKGEIKYNQTKNYCDVLPLDYSNKRIEFGQGRYYSKISS